MSGTIVNGVLVPAGQSTPFATITSDNHSAYIIISAGVGLSTTLVFAAIRVFVRKSISQGYGYDDWLLTAATMFVAVQCILVLVACGDGLGKSMELLHPSKIQAIQGLYYTSNIVYVFSMALSKAAVASLILRLTTIPMQRKFVWGLMGFNTIWAIGLLFSNALQCNPAVPWLIVNQKKQCADFLLRWRVSEIIGCVYELAIYGSAIWMVWDLQTKRKTKTVVLMMFGFRLLLVVIVALRLSSANQFDVVNDPTLRLSQFIAWTSAEMCYSIISATITILRPVVNNLATHYGVGVGGGTNGYGYDSGNGTNDRSAKRSRTRGVGGGSGLASFTRSKNEEVLELEDIDRRGGPKVQYSYSLAANKVRGSLGIQNLGPKYREDNRSVESSDSQKMIIRKDVEWAIEERV